jgi:hypothetical protein
MIGHLINTGRVGPSRGRQPDSRALIQSFKVREQNAARSSACSFSGVASRIRCHASGVKAGIRYGADFVTIATLFV